MTKMLITNAKKEGIPGSVHILIDGEKIADITSEKPDIPAQEIDAGGKLVLPGLINIHMHLDKCGLAETIPSETGTLAEARKKILEAKPGFKRSDIKARARKTVLQALQEGVTAIRSHVDVDPTIGLRGVEALLELKEELLQISHRELLE